MPEQENTRPLEAEAWRRTVLSVRRRWSQTVWAAGMGGAVGLMLTPNPVLVLGSGALAFLLALLFIGFRKFLQHRQRLLRQG